MQKIKISFIFFLLAGVFASCAKMSYVSHDSIPTYLSVQKNHNVEVVARGSREFYLWGLIPEEAHVVYLDEVLAKESLAEASNISIEEQYLATDYIKMFFTFGFFYTKSFQISAVGKKSEL